MLKGSRVCFGTFAKLMDSTDRKSNACFVENLASQENISHSHQNLEQFFEQAPSHFARGVNQEGQWHSLETGGEF
jgi:hypothetical protein